MPIHNFLVHLPAILVNLGPMGPFPQGVVPKAYTPGTFGFIVDLFIVIIVSLAGFTGSWGIAIMLTAWIVKLALLRLTISQYTAMAWMQVVGPIQKQLTDYFKGDKETANKVVLKLYQELKINPLAGCIPLLIQMPIFFSVFRALYNPHVFGEAKFMGIHLMYAALPALEMGMRSFGANVITLTQPGVVHFAISGHQVYLYLPATLFVLGYIGSQLYFQHIMKVMQLKIPKPSFAGVAPDPAKQPFNPNMMAMVIVVFGLMMPAGAMLYFITQNIWSIVEYTLIMNSVIPRIKERNLDAMYERLIKPEPKEPPSKQTPSANGKPLETGAGSANPDDDRIEAAVSAGADAARQRRKKRRR